MKTILMIEENPDIMTINRMAFENNYNLLEACDIKTGKKMFEKENPDLVLLDIMLPDGNGLDFCEYIKKTRDVPILLVSALGESASMIEGLRRGGDDYVTKPYDIDVLSDRVEVLLHRHKDVVIEKVVKIQELEVNYSSRIARLGDRDLLLTPKEFSLLEFLLTNSGNYFTAKELYEKVWGTKSMNIRVVKQHIYKIRKKLNDNAPVIIDGQQGKGYRIIMKT